MSDGYKAALKASRKTGRPYMLDFDSMPSNWVDVAFAIDYEDFKGRKSNRWVTFRSMDGDLLTAYCWLRKELRSFSLGRIENVIDQNGEARPVESVFPSALGYRQAETAFRKSRDAIRGYGEDERVVTNTESGFGAFSSSIDDRETKASEKDSEQPGILMQIVAVLFVILMLFAIYKLLVWIF